LFYPDQNETYSAYTIELPSMLKGAINDTIVLRSQINETESLIQKLTDHIREYKSQEWEFVIQRKSITKDENDENDEWEDIASGTDIAQIVDADITEGKSYVYRVQAANKNGKSSWSSEFKQTISEKTLRSPTNLNISSEFNFRLVFSWNDNSTNEDAFIIERKLSENKDKDAVWDELATVDADITQYVYASDQSPGIKYDYRVKAEGLGGMSKSTNTVTKKVTLKSPHKLKANANLKSALVGWSYSFGYNTKKFEWNSFKRRDGRVTSNTTDGVHSLSRQSLADFMQAEIDKQEELIDELKEELEFAKERISMFASLIDYDQSQRTTLKVFKNFAFIFALLFIALFGGMILSIAMSYIASLFYNVFTIRGNDPLYFMSLINDEKSKNKNQPLLAFTLWFLAFMFFVDGFALWWLMLLGI